MWEDQLQKHQIRGAIINYGKKGVATERGTENANREAPTAQEANITRQGNTADPPLRSLFHGITGSQGED